MRVKKDYIVLAVVLVVLAGVLAVAYIIDSKRKKETEQVPLSQYWAKESAVALELREYVAKVTDPSDKTNFIPEKDRIAVFDMDGTLTCETYYTYYDTMMFIEYCL